MTLKEQISFCLNCPKAECDNCLEYILKSKNDKMDYALENRVTRNNLIWCNGEEYTAKEWARLLNVKYCTLTHRLRSGINIEEMDEYLLYALKVNKTAVAYKLAY